MQAFLDRTNRFLDEPLDVTPRVLIVVAACVLALTFILPLWNLTMFAPQYPHGLRLDIFSFKLVGGNAGQDVKEINVLNHYIGMHDLVAEDFTEFKWMPFVIGAMALLFLRAAVHGHVAQLIDVVVIYGYFAAFSLWSFAYRMWSYGHNLAPTASVKIPPFMPPMFGYKQLANFEVYSYPSGASYALGASGLLLIVALWFARRDAVRGRRATAVASA
jgi:hypothetical protein